MLIETKRIYTSNTISQKALINLSWTKMLPQRSRSSNWNKAQTHCRDTSSLCIRTWKPSLSITTTQHSLCVLSLSQSCLSYSIRRTHPITSFDSAYLCQVCQKIKTSSRKFLNYSQANFLFLSSKRTKSNSQTTYWTTMKHIESRQHHKSILSRWTTKSWKQTRVSMQSLMGNHMLSSLISSIYYVRSVGTQILDLTILSGL